MPPSDEGKPPKRRVSTDKLKKLTGTLPLASLTKTQAVPPKAPEPAARAGAPRSPFGAPTPLDKTPMLTDEEAARAREKVLAMAGAARPAPKPKPAPFNPAVMKTQQLTPEEEAKTREAMKTKMGARPPAALMQTQQLTPEEHAKAQATLKAKMGSRPPASLTGTLPLADAPARPKKKAEGRPPPPPINPLLMKTLPIRR